MQGLVTFYAELFSFGPNACEPIVLTINSESHVMESVEGNVNRTILVPCIF